MTRHHPVSELKAALDAHHGAVGLAALSVGLTRQGLHKRVKGSQELTEICESSWRGRLHETAFLSLEVLVRQGNFAAIKHMLAITKGWDLFPTKEVEPDGQPCAQTPPPVGPELDRAIERILGILGSGDETSPMGPGDELPEGFLPLR